MRIGHYMKGIWDQGGVATYIRRLSQAQQATSKSVYYLDSRLSKANQAEEANPIITLANEEDLFIQAEKLKINILHLHTHVHEIISSSIPIIRTIHGNNPYCPSGSKYLKRLGQPCDRAYSLGGCLWGHLVDYCGSLRPQRFYPGFQTVWQEMNNLKQIPVIANSQFVKNQMVRSGYPTDKIHVLHLPAPEIREYLPPPQEDLPHFLFLGRITPEKGLAWLLQSLSQIKVPYHMDIAGSGNQVQEEKIHRLADNLGLAEQITFHGWVQEAKAIKLIKQARALIFPSVWHEPAGFVSLEAAAAGRAVIASRVGGIPEYAEYLQNALLVEPNDIGQLTKSIELLATDWDKAKQMGWEGRKMAKTHFSMEKHEQEVNNLYQLADQYKKN